ncbi:hypothetical protein BDV36DRAFT_285201 [Aspergillus pseudocaelatus]|uniref:Uncharacterized protein n=1 Tax=Aspergillus pseudocaelatus TaxID=1825620 RepID=A0ABQ6WHK7_9EURO|nr:hypothetical protein BDV36DRAFT_285201 [Aspergillus pseudocaelatus]
MAAIRIRTGEWTYTFVDIKDNTLGDIETLCPLDNGVHFRILKYTLGAWTVDSIPHYRKIITHAPDLIRGYLSVSTGSSYSCRESYETLCTAECESCGDFGGYSTSLCAAVFVKFALVSNDLKALPSMKRVPGRYSPRGIKCHARCVLFDHVVARQADLMLHGSVREMEQHAVKLMPNKLEHPDIMMSLMGIHPTQRRSWKWFVPHYLDSRTGSWNGASTVSLASEHHYNGPLHWRGQFTLESVCEHLQECREIVQ